MTVSSSHEIPTKDATGLPRPFGSRYVLLKELGKGGMGQVFVAVTGPDGAERVCALKVIRQLATPGREPEELGKRFLDEAKVVTKLSHENLVYVFDFGLVENGAYLAMEYVRGKSLTEVWNRCAQKAVGFPLGVAMYAVTEIAAGLAYAHAREGLHLVHRDISPSNLMLSYTGGAKLIDFGLAKWKSKIAQTVTGINWGKISYMSPEQYTGRPIDHRSDIFSLGVILWEMLTGKQLFPNEEARQSLLELPPPSGLNKNVSATLDRIVLKAMAFDPEDRFASAEQLGAALTQQIPRDAGKLQLTRFMAQLFDVDARAEAEEEERLVARASRVRPSGSQPVVRADAAERDPLVGATLEDRYFVRRLIGEGAMGRVYEGHHTGVGKRVAIKVPRSAERRKAELVQRFRMEANAASQIGHPNIADVTDCGTTPAGDFFFVMEFIDGVDADHLSRREGPLPVERALLIGIQMCRALEAAHKAGIIHRDLKPSNVMLVRTRDEADLVKVLDFGVAKFLRSDSDLEVTQADAAVGTPRFMAPEQMDRGAAIDFRVDIYAVGGVLWSLLSGGHAPFEGDSVQEIWRRKTTEPPPPLRTRRSDLPAELEEIVLRCLARVPEDRPGSMASLRRELVAVLERTRVAGSSVVGMKVPSSTAKIGADTTVQARGKRKALMAMTGVGAFACACALVWMGRHEDLPIRAVSTTSLAPEPQRELRAAEAREPNGEARATGAPSAAPPVQPAAPSATTTTPVALGTATAAALAAARSPTMPPTQHPSGPSRATATAHESHGAPAGSKATTKAPSPTSDAVASADAMLAEAELAFQRGQLAQALADANRAAKAGGGAGAWLLIGKTRYALGQLDDARAAYQHALALDPDNTSARRALEVIAAKLASAGSSRP